MLHLDFINIIHAIQNILNFETYALTPMSRQMWESSIEKLTIQAQLDQIMIATRR